MLTNFQIVPRTLLFLTATNAVNHFAGCIKNTVWSFLHPLTGGLLGALGRALDDKKQAKVPTLDKVGLLAFVKKKGIPCEYYAL